MTRTIRARIHETAVKRVTRIYAATLADIFAETLQNSRRAGATRIRIAPSPHPPESRRLPPRQSSPVTIADDGAGHRRSRRPAELPRERQPRIRLCQGGAAAILQRALARPHRRLERGTVPGGRPASRSSTRAGSRTTCLPCPQHLRQAEPPARAGSGGLDRHGRRLHERRDPGTGRPDRALTRAPGPITLS